MRPAETEPAAEAGMAAEAGTAAEAGAGTETAAEAAEPDNQENGSGRLRRRGLPCRQHGGGVL